MENCTFFGERGANAPLLSFNYVLLNEKIGDTSDPNLVQFEKNQKLPVRRRKANSKIGPFLKIDRNLGNDGLPKIDTQNSISSDPILSNQGVWRVMCKMKYAYPRKYATAQAHIPKYAHKRSDN